MWTLVDSRTGQRTTVAGFLTRRSAEEALARAWRNFARGRRPDLASSLPHTVVQEVER